MDRKTRNYLSVYCAQTGTSLTEQQMEFASDFTKPTYSISDPGTGKTHAAVAGIILAQTLHGVPGSKINAMSYTKLATINFAIRYKDRCEKLRMAPTVNFKTTYAICRVIAKEYIPNLRVVSSDDFNYYTRSVEQVLRYLNEAGIETDDKLYASKIYYAIQSLNSSLIFDPTHVRLSFKFKQLNIDLDVFTRVRKRLFTAMLVSGICTEGHLPLLALYSLKTNDNIQKMWKSRYRINVVDEFQDSTALQLLILSMISDNLIVIGDPKQAIYGFNGSLDGIFKAFKILYPDAKEAPLSQSFRCHQNIADFSTNIVKPNFDRLDPFIGVNDGGEIEFQRSEFVPLSNIVSEIKQRQERKELNLTSNVMFLARNNSSTIPIAEEFFQQGVLFRMNKYTCAFEVPMFRDMTHLIRAAIRPDDYDLVEKALYMIPEFSGYTYGKNPVVLAMKASGKDYFSVPYKYKDMSSLEVRSALAKVQKRYLEDRVARDLYSAVYKVYVSYILRNEWWKLDKGEDSGEYYGNLIRCVIDNKTWDKFIREETDKRSKTMEAFKLNIGVRIYTMHASKSLEADEIYIWDADEDVLPNQKIIHKYIHADCKYEAARDVRNERNLLYVAATRAKSRLVVCYNQQLTRLICDPNNDDYAELDYVYESEDRNYDDVGSFMSLTKIS